MRNADYKGRVESRNETRAAIPHSAFRIPHSGGVVKVLVAGGGTGGHLIPALALAQALRQARSDIEPVLVGAERGIEAQVLPRYPFRHHLLPMEPIYRRTWWRSEEHTSELQSRLHLVCRLLLEKKKKHHIRTHHVYNGAQS